MNKQISEKEVRIVNIDFLSLTVACELSLSYLCCVLSEHREKLIIVIILGHPKSSRHNTLTLI